MGIYQAIAAFRDNQRASQANAADQSFQREKLDWNNYWKQNTASNADRDYFYKLGKDEIDKRASGKRDMLSAFNTMRDNYAESLNGYYARLDQLGEGKTEEESRDIGIRRDELVKSIRGAEGKIKNMDRRLETLWSRQQRVFEAGQKGHDISGFQEGSQGQGQGGDGSGGLRPAVLCQYAAR